MKGKVEKSLTLISLTASSKDTIIKQNKKQWIHTHGGINRRYVAKTKSHTHTEKEA